MSVAAVLLSLITALVCALVLELGKHTLLGWILSAAAICIYLFVRVRLGAEASRLARFGMWAALIVALVLCARVSQPPIRSIPAVEQANPRVTPIVTVAQGDLTGVYTQDETVEVYTGIPYAKPPVGELRWREPQEPESWEGVRVCDHFAPMSMQVRNHPIFDSLTSWGVFHMFRPSLKDNFLEPMSEDSLYLNIWKPAGDVKDLPVMVFIHGGSLTSGQPSYSEYNGESLAKKGIIVVNFGYRLNVFGYLATEELAAESPNGTTGNYGLLDQIQALRWVQQNIAAFGGDPDQVTVSGESAGASSVNALCVSPLSRGLFRRAIAESSGITAKVPYHTFRTLADALAMGKNILSEFAAKDMDDLRAVDAEKLVRTKYTNNAMTVDGYAITEQPYLTYEKGENHEEALLGGFNTHEADLFDLFVKVTKDNYVDSLRPQFGDLAEKAAALYPPEAVEKEFHYIVERGGDAKGAYNKILSAAWFSYSHYNWSRLLSAQGRPVYEYCFDQRNAGLSANHGGEMPYVFGNLHRHAYCYGEGDARLSELMMDYWANFVKTGDPNGEGLPRWPQFAEDPGKVFLFGPELGPVDDPALALYQIIDEYQDGVAAQ
ncbi:MAG: carboxylesterase family protein [Oscillospiraceae bacterium]|nr:carboxylesterase family protein [Oscillospiraceae bacterium]